jgi:hypothetical protein
MPTSTDLVTDLPADFEVFGQAVDTSLADLKGGTTGQVLAKNSNTDMDFVWTAANPGDITGVTAGTGISGGGTSGTVTITNDMATTITTNGDLIYGTGSGTYTRRGIGSTGEVLTVSGGVPTWATASAPNASFSLLNTGGTTLSGGTTTVSGITGMQKILVVVVSAVFNGAAAGLNFRINADSGNNYGDIYNQIWPQSTYSAGIATASGDFNSTTIYAGQCSSASSQGFATLLIDGCNSTGFKTFVRSGGGTDAGSNGHLMVSGNGIYRGTSTVSSVSFISFNRSATSGTMYVYGSAS